jgi:hypothetical protein
MTPIQPVTGREAPQCAGTEYYVDAGGDDGGPGTLARPFRTIQRGIDMAQPGDSVVVRDGVYHEALHIANSGTALCPISIRGYRGERPVIDGKYSLPQQRNGGCDPTTGKCFNYGALVSIEGSHIVFERFEVTRSKGRGIRIWPKDYSTVRDCWVHENHLSGILALRSNHHTIESNRVWLSGDFAPYPRSARTLDWPGGIALREAHHCVVRGNQVFENWGEGIIPMQLHDILIENNVVYDNFAVNIYLATAGFPVVRQNLVYSSNREPFLRDGHPPSGIVLATEPGATADFATDQIIVNNILVGNRQNIAWWGEGLSGALINAHIAHNTLVNATANDQSAINLYIHPSAAHKNVLIENNVILQDTPGQIAEVPDDPAFTFRYNLWSAAPPDHASGPGDLEGDPLLWRPDAHLVPGAVRAEWYRLQSASPGVDAAHYSTAVPYDYFGTPRGFDRDMGAHEIRKTQNEPQIVRSPETGQRQAMASWHDLPLARGTPMFGTPRD